MKKVSFFLAVIMVLAILTSCGEANMNPGITSVDLKDSTENQQRWLSLPESKLVINPDAFSSGKDSSDLLKVPLNVGILETEGETQKVDKTINNLMFLLETNTSNGIGGNVIFEGKWGENLNFSYNPKQLTVEPISDDKVKFFVTDTHTDAWAGMTMKKSVEADFDKDVFLNVNVVECVGLFSLKGTIEAQGDIRKEGYCSYNLTDISGFTGKKKLQFTMYAIEKNNPVVVDLFEIREIEKGFHYASDKALSTWSPYSMTYQARFANGAEFEVTDYFADEKTIVRKLRAINGGEVALGGEYNGKVTYDEKKASITVESDGYKYVIAPKRKLGFKFFANEADMLAVKNFSDTATGDKGIWTLGLGTFKPDDELYIAISIDNEASTDELWELAKDKTNSRKAEEAYENRIEFWNTYLVENKLPTSYILHPGANEE